MMSETYTKEQTIADDAPEMAALVPHAARRHCVTTWFIDALARLFARSHARLAAVISLT